jgi:hypothetical protein
MITKIEDLEDNEYNRRYGAEIVRKSLTSPRNQWKQELNWILESDEWIPFAVTVTFKGLVPYEARDGMKKATDYEYRKRVLNKVRRRLCRSGSRWNEVLPIDYLRQYEYEQGSFFKPVPKSTSPHHIHAFLPIKKHLAGRVFNFEKGLLDERLEKDLRSIVTVSSFLIEPLRVGEAEAWARYMLKGKCELDFLD